MSKLEVKHWIKRTFCGFKECQVLCLNKFIISYRVWSRLIIILRYLPNLKDIIISICRRNLTGNFLINLHLLSQIAQKAEEWQRKWMNNYFSRIVPGNLSFSLSILRKSFPPRRKFQIENKAFPFMVLITNEEEEFKTFPEGELVLYAVTKLLMK